MERLQIYDRSKGEWSPRYLIHVGFKEEFKLDKQTDVGKDFSFKYYDETATEPTWNITDWVRVLHLETEDEPISYTAEGLPLNHNQYIINGIQKQYDPLNGYWRISLVLSEPIERTSVIVCETLSFTNQTEKTVLKPNDREVTYTKEPYNHLTALERVLKVTPANNNLNHSWYSRLKLSEADKAFLRGIPFSDTTFNELTLYGVLMDNYDSSTGRTPVMYFDMNTATDKPNDNTRDTYILKFERQDGFDKPVLDYYELIENCTFVKTISEASQGIKGLVTNVDNLMSDVAVNFPAQSLYAVPEVNQDKRDTTGFVDNGDAWVLRFPYKVKRITKLEELKIKGEVDYLTYLPDRTTLERKTLDVTNKVYEKKQYLADEKAFEQNVYWYEEGSEVLHLRPYKFEDDGETTIYYVEYEPLIDCRLEMGDNDLAVQVNQTTAQPSAERFGKFMSNYLDCMSKADILIQKTYFHMYNYNDGYSAFSDHIGSRVKKGDKEYLITNVSYVNRGDNYDAVYQLNENHFRKNTAYQAPQRIRTNLAIPVDGIKDRRTCIKQTVKIGFDEQTAVSKNQFLKDKKILLSALLPKQIPSEYYPQLALIESMSLVQNKETGVWESGEIPALLAEVAQFTFGNQVNVNIQYYDNALAGKSKKSLQHSKPSFDKQNVPFFGDVESQTPVLYTDYFGEVLLTSIYLSSIDITGLKDLQEYKDYTTPADDFEKTFPEMYRTIKAYNAMLTMPRISGEINIDDLKNNAGATLTDLNYYKDSLEKLNITLSFEAVSSDNNLIICDGLLKNSRLMRQTDNPNGLLNQLGMKLYSKNKSLNDDEDGFIFDGVVDILASTDNSITFGLEFLPPEETKTIIIYSNEHVFGGYPNRNLLIINNFNDNIREQLNKGELTIYFG